MGSLRPSCRPSLSQQRMRKRLLLLPEQRLKPRKGQQTNQPLLLDQHPKLLLPKAKPQQLLPRSQLKALPPPKLLPLRLLLLKLHQRKPLPRQLPKLLLRPRLPPKLPPRLLPPRSQPLKSQRQRLPPPRLCLPSARSSRASMEPEQGRFAPRCSSDAPRPSVLHATQNTPVSLPPKGARWMPTTSSSTH